MLVIIFILRFFLNLQTLINNATFKSLYNFYSSIIPNCSNMFFKAFILSNFAKDHTTFVMEQSWDGSHPETHWKHEMPLPGCDCITWVTHKLLTVVAAGNWTDCDIFMTWSNILKPPFWGIWGKPPFWGVYFFDDRTHGTYCSHLVTFRK